MCAKLLSSFLFTCLCSSLPGHNHTQMFLLGFVIVIILVFVLFFPLQLECPALKFSIYLISSLNNFSSITTKFSNLIVGLFNVNDIALLLNCFYHNSLLLIKGQYQSHLKGRRVLILLLFVNYLLFYTVHSYTVPVSSENPSS